MSRLAKLTDLFEEGRPVTLKTPAGGSMIVWINKLSPFEVEQTNHEGRIARARIMLAIKEIGTPEYDLFRANAQRSSKETIVKALVEAKGNEHLVKAIRDMHSDPEWREKLETLDWSSDQVAGKPDHDIEVQALAKVLEDYQAEIDRRVEELATDLRLELSALPPDALREKYEESYVEARGMAAFTAEREMTQVFYALRQCEATTREDGDLDHENCNHAKRWLEDRQEAATLPGALLEQVKQAIDDVNMAPDAARFSAALVSSSDSSGPSSKQEDSVDSGQTETSDEQGGISS